MKMSVLIKLERLSLLSVILSCLFFSSYSAFADNVDLDDRDLKTLSKLDLLDAKQVAGTAYKAGLVTFAYGSGIPTVVCALLELTDLAFEKGESILSVQLGDSVRWNIESAISGSANDSVEHLIVKPLEAGLKTSMLITTDRRTYHIRLKSTEADFMPAVVFSYPNSLKLPSKSIMGTIHIYSTQVTMTQMRIIMITQRLIQVLRTILLCKMFHMKETHDQRLMLLQPTMIVPKGETTTTLLMVTQKSFRKMSTTMEKNLYSDEQSHKFKLFTGATRNQLREFFILRRG